MRIMQRILAIIVSYLPLNSLRIWGYRTFFGYTITDSKIGLGTVIAVRKAEITKAQIGRNNRFIGPMSLSIHAKVRIGNSNEFSCGDWTSEEQFQTADYAQKLELLENSLDRKSVV